MNIEKYIERKIDGLNVLRFSNPLYIPGAIIDQGENDLRVGHIKDIIKDVPDDHWAVDKMPGNLLVEESIVGNTKIGAGANFLGVFNFKSSIKTGYDLDYEISEIVCSEFLTSSQVTLELKLNQIEKNDRETWKVLKGRTLITVAFYAKTFNLTFKRSGKISAKAEVEKDINVNGDVNIEWKTEGSVKISGNELVPFGVRGFKIK